MKKLISIQVAAMSVLLLFATVKTSYAQDSHVAILLNMVNSRLNYGDMNSSLQDYKKNVQGLQAGLSLQKEVSKHFSIVTEAYYIKKGGKLQPNNPLDGIASTLKLYTVEMPVLARFHMGRFYFNAGPYANYMISGTVSANGESAQSISFGPDEFRRWEAGMQAGLGYQFKIKKTRMAADLRFIHGFTSISRTDDVYNRTINVSVLVLSPLKRRSY